MSKLAVQFILKKKFEHLVINFLKGIFNDSSNQHPFFIRYINRYVTRSREMIHMSEIFNFGFFNINQLSI